MAERGQLVSDDRPAHEPDDVDGIRALDEDVRARRRRRFRRRGAKGPRPTGRAGHAQSLAKQLPDRSVRKPGERAIGQMVADAGPDSEQPPEERRAVVLEAVVAVCAERSQPEVGRREPRAPHVGLDHREVRHLVLGVVDVGERVAPGEAIEEPRREKRLNFQFLAQEARLRQISQIDTTVVTGRIGRRGPQPAKCSRQKQARQIPITPVTLARA